MNTTKVHTDVFDDSDDALIDEINITLDIGEHICRAMRSRNWTRGRLARRVGKKKKWLKSVLRGDKDITACELARIFYVMGMEARILVTCLEGPSCSEETNAD
jgi:transcriptional regulator with XRE-family HTH domain